jgi:hypothetical protein
MQKNKSQEGVQDQIFRLQGVHAGLEKSGRSGDFQTGMTLQKF